MGALESVYRIGVSIGEADRWLDPTQEQTRNPEEIGNRATESHNTKQKGAVSSPHTSCIAEEHRFAGSL
jgi:hypothetical protein